LSKITKTDIETVRTALIALSTTTHGMRLLEEFEIVAKDCDNFQLYGADCRKEIERKREEVEKLTKQLSTHEAAYERATRKLHDIVSNIRMQLRAHDKNI